MSRLAWRILRCILPEGEHRRRSIAGKSVVSVLWKKKKFCGAEHTVLRASCIADGRFAVLSNLTM